MKKNKSITLHLLDKTYNVQVPTEISVALAERMQQATENIKDLQAKFPHRTVSDYLAMYIIESASAELEAQVRIDRETDHIAQKVRKWNALAAPNEAQENQNEIEANSEIKPTDVHDTDDDIDDDTSEESHNPWSNY